MSSASYHVVVAPDSFKGALRAVEAAAVMAAAVRRAWRGVTVTEAPLSDGGEGFTEAVLRGAGGERIRVQVHDPLMRPVTATLGVLPDGRTAVTEMAAASGYELLAPHERNPWVTSSYGTGELIRAAQRRGCRRLVLGAGGSATVDGGAGMLQALGARLLDRHGNELPPGGGALGRLEKIDLRSLDKEVRKMQITVACDVTNPLTGPEGAAEVFAPQKGADAAMTGQLARHLEHLAAIIREATGRDIAALPHGGAAGGLAATLAACLGARLRPGFDVLSDLIRMKEILQDATLVLTGEGRTDRQTLYGKAPAGLARLARKKKKPILLFAGSIESGALDDLQKLFLALIPINTEPLPLNQALHRTREMLQKSVFQTIRTLHILLPPQPPDKK